MTDYTELKRLADELIAANDLFNESPQDNEVGDAWSLANDRFTEAASPEFILALIADNERIQEAHEQICTNYNQVSYASEERGKQIDQLKAELEHTGYDHDLLRNERDQLKAENDRLESEAVYSAAGFDAAREEISKLRAEVAGLKTGYEAYEQVNAELKAENERLRYQIGVLQSDANSWQSGYDVGRHMGTKTVWAERRAVRKDTERYRWLRRAGNTKAIALVAEHCLDALDEAIDAALGQGERSWARLS